MRGLLAVSLLLALAPLAAAHPPSQCLEGVPKNWGLAQISCEEHVEGTNNWRVTTVEIDVSLARVEVGHMHTWGSHGGARCYATYSGDFGPSYFGAGRECVGVWHDALP